MFVRRTAGFCLLMGLLVAQGTALADSINEMKADNAYSAGDKFFTVAPSASQGTNDKVNAAVKISGNSVSIGRTWVAGSKRNPGTVSTADTNSAESVAGTVKTKCDVNDTSNSFACMTVSAATASSITFKVRGGSRVSCATSTSGGSASWCNPKYNKNSAPSNPNDPASYSLSSAPIMTEGGTSTASTVLANGDKIYYIMYRATGAGVADKTYNWAGGSCTISVTGGVYSCI